MRAILSAALAALTLAACGDNGTTPPPGPAPVYSIAVSPADLTLAMTTTHDLEVILFDKDDNVLTGRTVTYASLNPLVATVSNTGRVTGVSVGTTRITITSEGKSTWVDTEVAEIAPAVASVMLSQVTASLQVGESLVLGAVALDANSQPIANLPVQWSSNRPGIVTVNTLGQLQAVAAGDAVITATIGGRSASAQVSVTAPQPTITTWQLVAVDRGEVTTTIERVLIDQSEHSTTWRITVLDEGSLSWNETAGTWQQRLVLRTFTRTEFQGNVMIGNVVIRTVATAGTSRALSPMGYFEFTTAGGVQFTGVPVAGGMETFQQLEEGLRGVHLRFARN